VQSQLDYLVLAHLLGFLVTFLLSQVVAVAEGIMVLAAVLVDYLLLLLNL
jgi:hypothetical protein